MGFVSNKINHPVHTHFVYGTWTIRTLDDSDLVNSDLILFYFGHFGPGKVRSELTKSQMIFRFELTKGQMDLRSELTNA